MIFENSFSKNYIPDFDVKEQGMCKDCVYSEQLEDYLICKKYNTINERNQSCKSWEKNKDGKE